MARPYVKKRRAEREEETRQRIVEATVALHQQKGGLRTTISDIAELSGVERATVYRHFPDERALFTACIGHYATLHPPPDPGPLAAITDPQERLRAGLSGLFAFYRETERMTGRALRDLPDLPVMADVLQPLFALIGQIHQTLLAPWRVAPGRETLVTAAIGHALSFWTWHSLVREQGLTEAEAVEALVTLVRALTEGE